MKVNFIIIAFIVIFLASCSEKTKKNEYATVKKDFNYNDQDSRLLQRILDYWYLRSTHQFKKSYEFELPYQTYLKGFDSYADEGATIYRKFHTEIVKIEYENEDTIATVYRKYSRKKVELAQKSKWIKIENEWYHKYDYTVFPEAH